MTVYNITMVPGDNALNPITIPGTTPGNVRTYSCAAGSIIQVPDFDALLLRNAGWVATNTGNAGGSAGATSGRPSYPAINPGFRFVDTTLNVHAVFVGPKTGWVNSVTGASV